MKKTLIASLVGLALLSSNSKAINVINKQSLSIGTKAVIGNEIGQLRGKNTNLGKELIRETIKETMSAIKTYVIYELAEKGILKTTPKQFEALAMKRVDDILSQQTSSLKRLKPTFIRDIIVDTAIDVTAEMVKDKLGGDSSLTALYTEYGIQHVKVALAYGQSGIVGAVLAETDLTISKVSKVIKLANELQDIENDVAAGKAELNTYKKISKLRGEYYSASSERKKEIESQIKETVRKGFNYEKEKYWGAVKEKATIPGASEFANRYIKSMKDVNRKKFDIFDTLERKVLKNRADNMDAHYQKALDYAISKFTPEEKKDTRFSSFRYKYHHLGQEKIMTLYLMYNNLLKKGYSANNIPATYKEKMENLILSVDSRYYSKRNNSNFLENALSDLFISDYTDLNIDTHRTWLNSAPQYESEKELKNSNVLSVFKREGYSLKHYVKLFKSLPRIENKNQKIVPIKYQSNNEYPLTLVSTTTEKPIKVIQHIVEKTYTPKDISNTNTPVDKTQIVKKAEKPNKHLIDEKIRKAREEAEAKRKADEQARKEAEALVKKQKIQALESELQRRYARNVELKERYKNLKLEFEKQQWSDFYKAGVTQAEVNQLAKELDESAAAVQKSRRELGIGKYEQRETIPFGSKGKAVSDYVDNELSKFKQQNWDNIAQKRTKFEKELEITKSSVNVLSADYEKALAKIKAINKKLTDINFKPTKEKEAEITKIKATLEKLKVEAEKDLIQVNINIRKQAHLNKLLAYADLEKYRYDGVEGSYMHHKKELDRKYANMQVSGLYDKAEFDSNYNEVMARLNQPIEKDPIEEPKPEKVVTGEFRGFFSAIGEERKSADFSYLELEKGASLTSDSKIITRFLGFNEGLENDNLTTGDGDHLGNYQYVGLGKWSSPNNKFTFEDDGDKTLKTHNVDRGYWVFGKPTKELPKTGSASFLGDVFGHTVDDNNQVEELDGDIGLKVDFNTQKIAGKMNVNYANKNKSFAKVKFSNGKVNLSDDVPEQLKDRDFTSFFDGEFVSNDENAIEWGDIVGAFYGDKAQESAGVWEIHNEKGNGTGVFRAKQTTQSSDLIPEDPNKVLKNWKGFYSSARKETKGDNVHFSSEYEEVASHNPIENGKVEIKNRSGDDYHEPNVSYDNYQYVSWGEWDYTHSDHGYDSGKVLKKVVYGDATKDIPKIGTAKYSGNIVGDYMNTEDKTFEQSSITGNIKLTANFKDRKISGTMDMKHNGKDWATANIEPTRIHSNAEYHTNVSLDNSNSRGSLFGAFYGKNAEETGGVFNIYKGTEHTSGTFRAKKQ